MGLMVLQWLTYAFWGWTVLGLSVLTATIVASFVSGAETGGFTPYGTAVVLVLLPIAFICDSFYIKKEPENKHGAEAAIMVIHAVIFAIFGVGALIAAVISVITMFVNSGDNSTSITALISSLIISVFYVLTLARTLNPKKFRFVGKSYRFVMILSVGVIAILGLVGPFARERATRDDRLISSNLQTINRSIADYAQDNEKLPESLSDLSLDGDAKTVVSRDLIEYKPESKESDYDLDNYGSRYRTNYGSTYKYQLCVTYKAEKKGYDSRIGLDSDEYETYINAYSYPKGDVCYKLKTTTY